MPQTVDRPTASPTATPPASPGFFRILEGLGYMMVWIGLAFVCAGSGRWLRGWLCAVVWTAGMLLMGAVVHLRNPALFAARARWHPSDTKRFDKILLALFTPLSLLLPAAAGFDVRLHRPSLPLWTIAPALALFLAALTLIGWTMAVNRWAESSVRLQFDRGQQVVCSGPYRFVRHPMYLGSLFLYPATACMLGSLSALAVAAAIDALFLLRTALEDRTLLRELPGYTGYAAVTRCRLIPGLW